MKEYIYKPEIGIEGVVAWNESVNELMKQLDYLGLTWSRNRQEISNIKFDEVYVNEIGRIQLADEKVVSIEIFPDMNNIVKYSDFNLANCNATEVIIWLQKHIGDPIKEDNYIFFKEVGITFVFDSNVEKFSILKIKKILGEEIELQSISLSAVTNL